jgi:aerobic C4-dicarboxylate transport protein
LKNYVSADRTRGRRCRALTNLCGNGVACIIVAWWEGELDRGKLNASLNREVDPSSLETAVTTG